MGKQNQSPRKPTYLKWGINSIRYGGQILIVAGIFILALPLGIYMIGRLFNLQAAENAVALTSMKISLAVGAVIAGLFILLLVVEFIQDRLLDAYFFKQKKTKVSLGDGRYECQHCGARNISALDKHCPICGEDFQI